MKYCRSCRVSKDEAQFNKDRTTKDGLSYECKLCSRSMTKAPFLTKRNGVPLCAKQIPESSFGNSRSVSQKKRRMLEQRVKYGQDVLDVLESSPEFETLGEFDL